MISKQKQYESRKHITTWQGPLSLNSFSFFSRCHFEIYWQNFSQTNVCICITCTGLMVDDGRPSKKRALTSEIYNSNIWFGGNSVKIQLVNCCDTLWPIFGECFQRRVVTMPSCLGNFIPSACSFCSCVRAEAKLVSCKVAMEELQLASVDGVPMEWLCGFFPKNPAAMEAAEIAVKDFPIL